MILFVFVAEQLGAERKIVARDQQCEKLSERQGEGVIFPAIGTQSERGNSDDGNRRSKNRSGSDRLMYGEIG